MSSDKRLRERYVEAYLHDARPMSVILKELGVSKATAKVWRQALRALAVVSVSGV